MAASSTDGVELSSFGSSIDILRLPENADQRDIDSLTIVTAGAGATITLRTKGSGNSSRTYNVVQGDRLDLQVRTIVSVSNVTLVRVLWGEH